MTMRNIEEEIAEWRNRLERPEGAWEVTILARAREGDSDAIHQVIHHCESRIARIVDARLGRAKVRDKEDLFQEAFVQVFNRVHKGQFAADSEASFARWLVLVVTRVLAELLMRQASVRREHQFIGDIELRTPGSESEDVVLGEEMKDLLQRAMNHLQGIDQEVLQMQLEGLSLKEIGEKLGMSAASVSRRFRTVLYKLREHMERNGPFI